MTPRGGLFISYARADASLALRLYELLAGAGQDVWLDMANLRPEIDWWDGVRRAIDQSAVMLFLVSGESSRSMSCSRELAYAVVGGKRIVPIDVEPAAFSIICAASGNPILDRCPNRPPLRWTGPRKLRHSRREGRQYWCRGAKVRRIAPRPSPSSISRCGLCSARLCVVVAAAGVQPEHTNQS